MYGKWVAHMDGSTAVMKGLKKCFDSRGDPHIALLQIHMTLLGQGLPSPATILFNHQIRGIMPIINRPPVGIDNDEEHHKAILKRQMKDDKNKGTPKNYVSIPKGSTVMVQWEDGGPWIPWHDRRERQSESS